MDPLMVLRTHSMVIRLSEQANCGNGTIPQWTIMVKGLLQRSNLTIPLYI